MQSLRSARVFSGARLLYLRPIFQTRTFHGPTRSLNADLVQDLYLKELKSYKPSPVQPTDADAHVRKFVVPKAPTPPEEGDITQDLKAYEDIPVEVEGALASGEQPVDKFAQFLEDELKFYEQEDKGEQH